MINLAPIDLDSFAESVIEVTLCISKNIPAVGNAIMCIDGVVTNSRAGVNFCCFSNLVTKDIEFVRQTIGHLSLNATSDYVSEMRRKSIRIAVNINIPRFCFSFNKGPLRELYFIFY